MSLNTFMQTPGGIQHAGYQYDKIGNLIDDSGENVQITWNAAGKVKSVTNNQTQLNFSYSPTGQRQIKSGTKKQYYIHDATGNIMCIYEPSNSGIFHRLYAVERPIYGSSRIGVNALPISTSAALPTANYRNIGTRQFELSNHLGNVQAVISDRKIVIFFIMV